MADGTSYDIDIPVNSASAASAASTVDELAMAIDRAGASSAAASKALAAGTASYAQAETAANKAALASERMGVAVELQRGKLAAALETGDTSAIDSAEAKLAKLVARQGEAEARSSSAASALAEQASSLDGLQAAAQSAADEEATLASRLDAATQAEEANGAAARETADATAAMGASAEEGGGSLQGLSRSLGKLGGPAGEVGSKVAGFANAFSKLAAMGPAGVFIAVAVASVAVVAGIAMATLGLLKFGLANADAARTNSLLAAGMVQSMEGGERLSATIDDMTKKFPQSRDEISSMAASLAKTGLRGAALEAALEKTAAAAAKVKFGPEWALQMTSVEQQQKRLKAGVGGMFAGLKIEKLLTATSEFVSLLDESSAAGRAIKVVFESMFQPLVDGMANAVPKMVAGFLQFEIWALRSLIAIQQYQPAFDAVGSFAIAMFNNIGSSIQFVWTLVTNSIAGFVMLGELGSAALHGLSAAALEVRAFLLGLTLQDIGLAMVKGLADGITGGGASVLAASTGVADGAIKAAKKALGIASPSRVFAEIGGQSADGMVQGVEAKASDVSSSLEAMVAPPALPAPSAPSATPGVSSGGGNTFTIIVHAGAGADDIATKVREAILDLLEGTAQQAGGMVQSG